MGTVVSKDMRLEELMEGGRLCLEKNSGTEFKNKRLWGKGRICKELRREDMKPDDSYKCVSRRSDTSTVSSAFRR